MSYENCTRHVAFEDLGSLAAVLYQMGYAVTYVEMGLDRLDEIDPLLPDLVVVLEVLLELMRSRITHFS